MQDPNTPTLNYDVLLDVVRSLDPWNDTSRSGRPDAVKLRALARTARSCRALSGIALDVLWRKLDDIGNLLALLSAFMFFDFVKAEDRVAIDTDTEITYEPLWLLREEILPGEWTRFEQYAHRVRILTRLGPSKLEPAALVQLFRLTEGKPLLPNIEEIEYEEWHAFDPSILFLVAPSLRILRVNIWRNTVARNPQHKRTNVALNLVLRRSSGALEDRDFSLTDVPLLFGLPSDLLPRNQCNNLTRAVFDSWEPLVDFNLLRGLASLPNLIDLSLSLHRKDEMSDYLHAHQPFQSLRKLRLYGSATQLAQFLEAKAVSAPHLHFLEFKIEWYIGRAPELCHRCATAICANYSASLREIKMGTPRGSHSNGDSLPEGPFLTAFEPLLDMHDLERVHLRAHQLHRMAEAWPMLTDLRLEVPHPSSFVSPASVLYLASQCLNLRALSLPSFSDNFYGLKSEGTGYVPLFPGFVDRPFPCLDLDRCVFPSISSSRTVQGLPCDDRCAQEIVVDEAVA
ncbi:hypothetical protein IEO21_03237 [Rhodonia placenta]|uniref:Uncharacterized protein n=1 Tax=Rhodonia placenta TaxID=104341 RepID=A0A8H7U3Q6_9APHY|nr:hypothetical protein IEO21_03237 [Postia placenta]